MRDLRAGFYLKTLETPRLYHGGVELPLPTRGAVLLAILSMTPNGRAPRAWLINLLWSAVPENRARHSLSQLLHHLKSTAPALRLRTEDDDIVLEDVPILDVNLLRDRIHRSRVDGALRMYGDFLANVGIEGTAFENWRSERQRQIVAALEAAVHDQLRYLFLRGEYKACHAFSQLAASKLGEYWDTSLLPAGIAHEAALATTATHSYDTPLVGRDSELELLYRAYETAARDGTGCALSLCSEAGQGKTVLASAFLRAAERLGAVCIVIRGYQPQRSSGLHVFRELLANELFNKNLSNLGGQYSGYLQAASNGTSEPKWPDPGARNFAFDAAARLIELSCRDRPVILFFDDLHWMDDSSLEFIAFLARKTVSIPLLVITAYRPSLPAHRQQSVSNGQVLHLGSLSLQEINAYVRTVLGARRTKHLSKAIVRRTGGHPYLVGQIAKGVAVDRQWSVEAVAAISPPSIRAFLAQKINGISPGALLLFQCIVVLGKPTRSEVVRRVVRFSVNDFLISLQELLERDLVADGSGFLSCAHDLVREIAYSTMSSTHRRTFHRRCGEVLVRSGAASGDVLFHLRKAKDRTRTYVAALREARLNARLGAGVESNFYFSVAYNACRSADKRLVISMHQARGAMAFGLLRTARRLLTRLQDAEPQLLRRCAAEIRFYLLSIDYELGRDNSADLRRRAREVSEQASSLGDIQTHVSALILEGRLHLLDGYADEHAVEAVIHQLTILPLTAGYTETTVEGIAWAAGALVFLGRTDDAEKLVNETQELACKQGSSRLRAHADASAALLASHRGWLKDSIKLSRSALANAERHGLWRLKNNVLANLSGVLIEVADDEGAESVLEELMRSGDVDQGLPQRVLAYTNCALLLLHQNHLTKARAHANNGLRLAEKVQKPWAIAYTSAILGLVAIEQGSIAEAKLHRDRVLALAYQYFGNDQSEMAKLLARLAEFEDCHEVVATSLNQMAQQSRLSATSRATVSLETARLIARKDPDRAWEIVTEVREQARRSGAVRLFEASEALETRLLNRTGFRPAGIGATKT